MHTALIFIELAKSKDEILRVKGLHNLIIQYNILKGMIIFVTNTKNIHSSIIETRKKEYCPATMNIYFIQDRQEQKRLSGIP
jgi:hypothetical protein